MCFHLHYQPEIELLPATDSYPQLLQLPLRFPSSASPTPLLTRWSTLSLPLHTLLSSLPHPARLKAVVGVEVHATCRLRRIWFSEEGVPGEVDDGMVRRGMMREMALYAAD